MRLLTLLPVTLLASCSFFESIRDEGLFKDKDYSIFTSYSGQYCRILGTENGDEREIRSNCENLTQFLSADSAACEDSSFRAEKAYFPEQDDPMYLCRELVDPSLKTRNQLRFIVFADAGAGQSKADGYAQEEVSQAMLEVCRLRGGCDFSLSAGDLIYPNGVRNVWDREFGDRFEKVYSGFAAMPFFMVPGNHDYYGNVTAEVEYTWFSERWRMFDRYYAIPQLPAWLQIFGLDSNAVVGDSDAEDTAQEQLQAAEEYLCKGDGWKIIFGHHPSHSHGQHGPEDAMADWLLRLHKKCPFQFYLTGHDHHQEHVATDLFDVILQGGGGARVKNVSAVPFKKETRKLATGELGAVQRYAKRAHGFALFEVEQESVDIYFFDSGVWNYGYDGFNEDIDFDDYIYHCQAKKGVAGGCKLVKADSSIWVE